MKDAKGHGSNGVLAPNAQNTAPAGTERGSGGYQGGNPVSGANAFIAPNFAIAARLRVS